MENLVLIGGGGHAKSCIDIIQSTSLYNMIGYVDFEPNLDSKFGIPYLGKDEVLVDYIQGNQFLICLGQMNSSNNRERIFNEMKALGAKFATIISPIANVSKFASLGEGSIIFHGVTIQADALIGNNCIVNNHSLIEHDCQIGNNCHISTGAIVNGNVNISDGVFIGSAAVLKQGISIGEKAVIGMGSIVLVNVEANQVIFGNPAKLK